jgi:hypothetical protein
MEPHSFYVACGWEVLHLNTQNVDFIAKKGAKIHFVKVTKEPMHSIHRNNFVQNAFSNNAIPINVVADGKLKFVDMNSGSNVRIGKPVVVGSAVGVGAQEIPPAAREDTQLNVVTTLHAHTQQPPKQVSKPPMKKPVKQTSHDVKTDPQKRPTKKPSKQATPKK